MLARRGGGDGRAMAENYDVIIIGSGAGGGTLAHTGAVNPALTAIANAMRVGEHIRDRIAS